jgi:ATP synthase F1 delta subunit
MKGERIAKRYAAALFDLCEGNIETARRYRNQLEAVATLYDYDDIRRVLMSPVVSSDLKSDVLENAVSQVEADDLLKAFLREVANANRVDLLPQLVRSYHRLLNEKTGVAEAEAVTVVELNDDDQAVICEKLQKLIGKTIELRTKVDQSILGGFVIKLENNVIDMSLKSKLDALTKSAVR